MNNEKQIGRLLRAKRKRKSLTKEELAKLAGISQRTIYNIEHGNNTYFCNVIAYATAVECYVSVNDWQIEE